MFKDIFGKEIQVGDHIIYVKSWASKNIEEAIVTQCDEKCVRVEYLGKGSPAKYHWQKKKEAGKKSRFTATEKKVIIISSSKIHDTDRAVFNEAMTTLQNSVKKAEDKLAKAAKEKINLLEKIEVLQAKVDKIPNRYHILDFSRKVKSKNIE